MTKPFSDDLRERVVTAMQSGASCRTRALIGKDSEAWGIVVTGQSRVGKTAEIKKLVSNFNSELIELPDGRPARIVRCILSRKITAGL